MKFVTMMTVLMLAATTAFANHHEGKKKGHDKEHSHVEDAKVDHAKVDHAHEDAHHQAHDHKAHHPEHAETTTTTKKETKTKK